MKTNIKNMHPSFRQLKSNERPRPGDWFTSTGSLPLESPASCVDWLRLNGFIEATNESYVVVFEKLYKDMKKHFFIIRKRKSNP